MLPGGPQAKPARDIDHEQEGEPTGMHPDEWAKTEAFLREQRLLLHRRSSH